MASSRPEASAWSSSSSDGFTGALTICMLTLGAKLLPLGVGELRQPSQGRDELPDLLLGAGGAKGRHARHADSIRDDPLELAVGPDLNARQGETRRRRVQAGASFGRIDPRSAVAGDTMRAEQPESRSHGLGRAGERVALLSCMSRDRAIEREPGDPLLETTGRLRG